MLYGNASEKILITVDSHSLVVCSVFGNYVQKTQRKHVLSISNLSLCRQLQVFGYTNEIHLMTGEVNHTQSSVSQMGWDTESLYTTSWIDFVSATMWSFSYFVPKIEKCILTKAKSQCSQQTDHLRWPQAEMLAWRSCDVLTIWNQTKPAWESK